jgi:hypothetical protein
MRCPHCPNAPLSTPPPPLPSFTTYPVYPPTHFTPCSMEDKFASLSKPFKAVSTVVSELRSLHSQQGRLKQDLTRLEDLMWRQDARPSPGVGDPAGPRASIQAPAGGGGALESTTYTPGEWCVCVRACVCGGARRTGVYAPVCVEG